MRHRPHRRLTVLCGAVIAALALASCTPAGGPAAQDPASSSSGRVDASAESGQATDPWAPPKSGSGAAPDQSQDPEQDEASGEPSQNVDGEHTDQDGLPYAENPDGVDPNGKTITALPASQIKKYLDRGAAKAGGSVRAPGLSWGDGAPVEVGTLSLLQAREAPTQPVLAMREYAAPASDGGEEVPLSRVVYLGNQVVLFAGPTAREDGGSDAPTTLRYSTGRAWKNGPRLGNNDPGTSQHVSDPLAVGGRVYWTLSTQNDANEWSWVLHSWKPGESKLTTEASSDSLTKGLRSYGAPPRNSSLIHHKGRLYFAVTLDSSDSDTNQPTALISVPLTSGAPRLEAKEGSRPYSTSAGLVFSTTYPDVMDNYTNRALRGLRLLSSPGESQALLNVTRDEAQRGVAQVNAQMQDSGDSSPVALLGPPTLVGAQKNTVTLIVRGQVVSLDLSRRKGSRLVPAQRIAAAPADRPVQCGDKVAFPVQLLVPQGADLASSPQLWVSFDSNNGTLLWQPLEEMRSPSGCAGEAFTAQGIPVYDGNTVKTPLARVTVGGS